MVSILGLSTYTLNIDRVDRPHAPPPLSTDLKARIILTTTVIP